MKDFVFIFYRQEVNFPRRLSYKVYLNKSFSKVLNSIFIFPFCFLISSSSYSQFDTLQQKYFSNDSIRYNIIYVSHSVLSKENDHTSKHYVSIRLSKQYRNFLLEKDSSFWFERLRNNDSDWATNLILYYLYDRDATPLTVFKDRKKWLKIKNDDIKYWHEFLSAATKKSKIKG